VKWLKVKITGLESHADIAPVVNWSDALITASKLMTAAMADKVYTLGIATMISFI
jgi:hypothetical protein